jgi:hypothetical protein
MVNEQIQLLSRIGIDVSQLLIIQLVDVQRIKSIAEIITELEHAAPHKFILFDYASAYEQRPIETVDTYNNIKQLNLNKPWVFTTSDFNYYNTKIPNIVYFPFYVILFLVKIKHTDIDIKSRREFLLGYLTHHLHDHRLFILLKLIQQPWIDKCLYNFLANTPVSSAQLMQLDLAEQWILTAEERQHLNKLKERAPIIADHSDKTSSPGNINNAAFTNCYVHLFSESGYPFSMVTEKSITPYLTGQLPMILGGNGLTTHMQQLNFEIFDDILPNINTNSAEDIRVKIDNLLLLLSNLFDNNIEYIWDQTYERRLHNYNWVRSNEFLNLLVSPLQTALA